ncbi:MAG: DUF4234 domain-containing protein [Bdellovibrionales bacterium]|nr:DUF4234 domain-containing protein [Bdellovibrionales bacterium]
MNGTAKALAPNPDFVRSIAFDLVLTVLTFGLFNLFVQYRQIKTVNVMLGYKRYSFLKWFLLCLITFGLYHIYHEYRKSTDIAKVMQEPESMEPLISLILTALALPWVADAIQQVQINRYFGSETL